MTHETAEMSCAACSELLPELIAGTLPEATRRAVERHLAACASCRAESREWRAIATGVRASELELQPVIPFAQSWSVLRERLSLAPDVSRSGSDSMGSMDRGNPSHRQLRVRELDPRAETQIGDSELRREIRVFRPQARRAPLSPWAVAVAVAAVIVLVAGFAQVFAHFRDTSQAPVPAATPAPPKWQSVTPPQLAAGQRFDSFAASPANGDLAFLCAVAPSTLDATPTLWATHDRGTTWTRASDVPLRRSDLASCSVVPDSTATGTLVMTIAYGASAVNGSFPLVSYVTTDGGQSWRALPFSASSSVFNLAFELDVFDLASVQGKTYAVLNVPPNAQGVTNRLEVSSDQMRTWRPIDGALLSAGNQATRLFADPSSGQLAVEGDPFAEGGASQLYLTSDGGQTWSHVGPILGTHGSYFAAPPAGGHPWRFCALFAATRKATVTPLEASCSMDGGRSWQDVPGLGLQTAPSQVPNAQLAGLLPDGTLLGEVWLRDRTSMNTVAGSASLYRVAPGSQRWQPWGAGQIGTIEAAPRPGGGAALWAVNLVKPGSPLPWQISVKPYPG